MASLVNQRHDWDCVIASIAMWVGVPYEDVLKMAEKCNAKLFDPEGMTTFDEYNILRKFGKDTMIIHNAYGGLSGILSLPSLNTPGGAHAVFFDKTRILDPQTGREGRKWYPELLKGTWPSCYKFRIDLKDPESALMAQAELNSLQSHINRATKILTMVEMKVTGNHE